MPMRYAPPAIVVLYDKNGRLIGKEKCQTCGKFLPDMTYTNCCLGSKDWGDSGYEPWYDGFCSDDCESIATRCSNERG